MNRLFWTIIISNILVLLGSCQPKNVTGWDYNSPNSGGFQKIPVYEQETGIGLILIEGRELVLNKGNTNEIKLSVNSFYISKYEETNGQYLAYLNYLQRYYSSVTYKNALPDTNVWSWIDLTNFDRDFLRDNYLRNASYKDFPVVGLNSQQIIKYADWKTDRMNELILIREEIIELNSSALDSSHLFTTQTYFYGQYPTYPNSEMVLSDLNPNNMSRRIVRREDGILMPKYRLPTSSEWQLSSIAIGDSTNHYVTTPKESKIKKENIHNFGHLKIDPDSYEGPIDDSLISRLLRPVYVYSSNNYLVHGLSNGINEFVMDSLDAFRMGRSSINENTRYTAIFCDSTAVSFNYEIVTPISTPMPYRFFGSQLVGFRLAMDRIGAPIITRRKRKGKKP